MSHLSKSDELFELYRQLDETAAAAEIAGTGEVDPATEDEARYALSQWNLMWRKFIRNKAALAGGTVIVLFYLTALFGQFIAPYTLTTRFRDRIYMRPQMIHFFDDGKFVGPFVYGATNLPSIKKWIICGRM